MTTPKKPAAPTSCGRRHLLEVAAIDSSRSSMQNIA
jgi:hypothetical protein